MRLSKSRAPFRNWVLGQSAQAGSWKADCVGPHDHDGSSVPVERASSEGNMHVARPLGEDDLLGKDYAPTWRNNIWAPGDGMGAETVPRHIWQPVIIYLGRPK